MVACHTLKAYVKVVEDELFTDAKDDLQTSIDQLTTIEFKKLSSKESELPAVISFQQTCVDGFPEGKMKTNLQNLFKDSKEFVSNSLAMVTQVSTFLSTVQTLACGCLLLSNNSHVASLDSEGIPSYIHAEERRVLKAAADNRSTLNVTFAKDGSGDFKTISEALAAIPKTYTGRYMVFVKEGVYNEQVAVTKKMQNVTMYGEGSQKSIITGSKNFRDGVRTFITASFMVEGDGFLGLAMGLETQLVLMDIKQWQREYKRIALCLPTVVSKGEAAVVFQNCIMIDRKPMDNQGNMVTAQGRMNKQQTTGIIQY
ncbi:pectinesterase [Trifolium repens]|nr:pectinesterase [Trifolium repens]